MRIHNDAARNAEGCAQDDVRRFAGGTGNSQQRFDRVWDLTLVFFQNALCGSDDVLGLVVVKTGRVDIFTKSFWRRDGEIFDSRILGEEARSDHVYAFVGALCAEDRGHKKFPGIRVVQSTGDIWENLVEDRQDLIEAGLLLKLGARAFGSGDRSRHAKLAA